MNKFRKCFIWYVMSGKRLLHKMSFVILLLLIPVMIFATNSMMTEDGGVLKIVLCTEDKNPTAQKTVNSLLENESVIYFYECNTRTEAETLVKTYKADAAWIFAEDFDKVVDLYAKGEGLEPLVSVVQREDTVPLQLSREILYSAIFEDISYSLYSNFVYTEVVSPDEISQDTVKDIYYGSQKNGEVVKLWRYNTGEIEEKPDILTAPLRGILSLVVLLCTLAAAMYFLSDQREGKYDWLPYTKRLAPAFALCLSAAVFAGIAVFFALQICGYSTGILSELISIILLVLMSVAFALFFCILFSSPAKLGAALPGIMIVSLVLSPIFFNLKVLRPLRLMLPTYYYLQSTYNSEYYWYSLLYCVVAYSTVLLLNAIKNRMPGGNSI